MDTIFALASGRGKAGVSVIRISGPEAFAAAGRLCGRLPEPRRAALRRISWAGEVLDEGLVLVFPERESFTGEASVELQVHGSVAGVRAVLAALAAQQGLRPAEAGEFTRRALENGRLDLTQVEGLADLIEAETESQRRQALKVMSGALAERARLWRRDLVRSAALIEASIDFVDEDVPVDVRPEVRGLVDGLLASLRVELAGAAAAERIRDGFEVAIVGSPNAGKSTLLNALAGREAAITSEVAGTTRDVIEVHMDIAGLAVTLLDTAGLRDAKDVVERIGVDRAISRAKTADLRVFLLSERDERLPLDPLADDILVLGKADLHDAEGMAVSGRTGKGLDDLIAQIADRLSSRVAGSSLLVRERHLVAIRRAVERLEGVATGLAQGRALELMAEDLREATFAVEALVGRIDVESLLDEIFSSFCIGK